MALPKVVIVLTSHSEVKEMGYKTGLYPVSQTLTRSKLGQGIDLNRTTSRVFYLQRPQPELAHAYNVLAPHVSVTVASPAGGESPFVEDVKALFQDDKETLKFLSEKSDVYKQTIKLETLLSHSKEFSAVYFPGGHGRELLLTLHTLLKAVPTDTSI